ncbi:MAG: glycosyltransferase family 4 protein [Vicinamibacterales bacterium]
MPALVFLVPGRLETPTGGYIYDRRMAEGLRRLGWVVDVRQLDDTFPYPTPYALEHAARVLAEIRAGATVMVDGLAFGAMADLVEREASRLRFVALVHLPLAADIGLDRDTAARFEADERRALGAASLLIVTGTATLPLLDAHGLKHERTVVVEPGTDIAPLAGGSAGDGLDRDRLQRAPLRLVCVATLNPGKGHEILFRALAALPHRHWRLTCAGSTTRHPATTERLRELLRAERLESLVTLVGELDATGLAELYDESDVFVLATLQETYGMAVAEALARGLPVVGTTTGALPELVGDVAGLLVPPGNVDALRKALGTVLDDAELRARLTAGARKVRERLPTWEQAAVGMARALALVTHDE